MPPAVQRRARRIRTRRASMRSETWVDDYGGRGRVGRGRWGAGHVFSARPDTLGALTGGRSKPIADYGLLADCNSAALVDRDGSIAWLCLPRFDSPAVFAGILDPDAGHWTIRPTAPYRSERRYLPGTLVIETTFTTETGSVRLTDAMAFAEGQRVHDLGLDAPHLLLRLVEGLVGEVELSFELAPRPEYGLVRPLFRQTEHGGRTFGGPNQIVVGCGAASVGRGLDDDLHVQRRPGEQVGFAMQWSPPDGPVPEPFAPARVAQRIADTVAGWSSWEAVHDVYAGPHRALVRLSSRVLKGLMYRPDGRDRRRAHDIASGGGGRGAKLGLPLCLDSRRQPDARGALHRRLSGGGRGLRLVHDQLRRRPGR